MRYAGGSPSRERDRGAGRRAGCSSSPSSSGSVYSGPGETAAAGCRGGVISKSCTRALRWEGAWRTTTLWMRCQYSSDWCGIIPRLYVLNRAARDRPAGESAPIQTRGISSGQSRLRAESASAERQASGAQPSDAHPPPRRAARHPRRDRRRDVGRGEGALRKTVSLVDKMAGKGLIHRNTAARYKSRLASRVAKKSAATASLAPEPPRHIRTQSTLSADR